MEENNDLLPNQCLKLLCNLGTFVSLLIVYLSNTVNLRFKLLLFFRYLCFKALNCSVFSLRQSSAVNTVFVLGIHY